MYRAARSPLDLEATVEQFVCRFTLLTIKHTYADMRFQVVFGLSLFVSRLSSYGPIACYAIRDLQ